MKKFARKKCRKMFLEVIFFAFESFRTKLLSLLYIKPLAYKISHCLSAKLNPESRCVICTGVTLELALLKTNQKSSNFFHVYYKYGNEIG